MAASSMYSASYVDEMLICSICTDVVTEPRTLAQCFHSFCKECIQQVVINEANPNKGVTCPNCRKFSDECDIRSNFFINDLLAMHKSHEEAKLGKKRMCQQCDSLAAVEAHHKCLDCRLNLCNVCHKTHLNIPLLKGHRVLPIIEDVEMVIDRLVFCEIHDDEPIKFYCTPCDKPICIKCKVTDHDSHKTVTVEKALEKIVPEIEDNTTYLEGNLINLDKAISDIDEKITEVENDYVKCQQNVTKKAKDMIKKIQEKEKNLKDQLNMTKEREINKLKEAKNTLHNEHVEGDNMRKLIKTSIDTARHATLLTGLTQGNLHQKVANYKTEKQQPINLKVQCPKLEINKFVEEAVKTGDMLGSVSYSDTNVQINVGQIDYPAESTTRVWPVHFEDVFSKRWSKVLTIKLNGYTKRLSTVGNNLGVVDHNNNRIDMYNKKGELQKTVPIAEPLGIQNGGSEVFVASKKGLFTINKIELDKAVKIYDGNFVDITMCEGELCALEYSQGCIITMRYDDSSKLWKKHTQVSMKTGLNVNATFVPCISDNVNNGDFYFCSGYSDSPLYKYTAATQHIDSYNNSLYYPHVCGTDPDNCVLVADYSNTCFKVFHPHDESWTTFKDNIPGISGVYDAIIDVSEQPYCVWISQYNRDSEQHEVIKYQLDNN